jgi:hypothetical protein
MPKILAVHASDANPVLEIFRSRLDAGPISFLNVEDAPARRLRSRILDMSRDIDICLIFSSGLLLRLLRPLASSRESRRDSYLLSNRRTRSFQLNLARRSRNVRALWRDLFHADVVQPGAPLLRMQPESWIDMYETLARFCGGHLPGGFTISSFRIPAFFVGSESHRSRIRLVSPMTVGSSSFCLQRTASR